jgi:hypothetical protein
MPALLAESHVDEPRLAKLVPKQQAAESGSDDQDLAFVAQRLARNGICRIDIVEVFGERPVHGDVIGGAAPSFLEGAIFGLFLGVEGRAGRRFGERLERLVRDDGIALAGYRVARPRRARVEKLQTGFRINSDRHVDRLFPGFCDLLSLARADR